MQLVEQNHQCEIYMIFNDAVEYHFMAESERNYSVLQKIYIEASRNPYPTSRRLLSEFVIDSNQKVWRSPFNPQRNKEGVHAG